MADEHGRGAGPHGEAAGAPAGRPPIDRRRLLKGAGAGSLLLTTAGVVGACGDVSAGGGLQLAQNQPGAAPPTPGGLPSVPNLRDGFGATAGGVADDTLALAAVPPGTGVLLTPGVYRVASDVTIHYHMWVMPGAVLRPDRGATITWAPGCSITAGDYQIFDDSAGGGFGGGVNTVGWARSSWFPGETRGRRDLGKQIGNAFAWGFLQVDVPPAPDHVIRTTVNLPHGATVRCMWHGYPRHVVCATDDRPVFEAVGGVRHWRIIGGVFDGAATDTPSCFLLCGRDDAALGQCGDTTALSETQVTGNWGIGVVVSISAEVLVFSNCNLWTQGRGDTSWRGPFATVVIANADFWNVPYVHTRPSRRFGSCSAVVFQSCDIRGGVNDEGSVFLLKGQVEDVSVVGTYLNTVGRCHILCEPGSDGGDRWTSPRRIYVGGGGRTETNKGIAWPGVPTVVVDGLNRGGGLYLLTFGEMGQFVGAESNSTPVIRTERGGVLYAFTMHQGGHIEWTDKLIEHRTADLVWADVRCPLQADIDCEGRWLHDCDIKIAGRVIGDIGPGSKVRAANTSNW